MFGMDNKKKKKGMQDWEFDLEKQLSNPAEAKSLKTKTEERVQQLKTWLRQGKDKKSFDETQTLLHGYLAVQKILMRLERK